MPPREETTHEWCERLLADVDEDGSVVVRFGLQGRDKGSRTWTTFGHVDRPKSAKNFRAAAHELHDAIDREVLNCPQYRVRVIARFSGARHMKATKVWPVFHDEDNPDNDDLADVSNASGDRLAHLGFAEALRHNRFLIQHTASVFGSTLDRLHSENERLHGENESLREQKSAFIETQQAMLDRTHERHLKTERQAMFAKGAEAVIAVLKWKLTGASRPEGGNAYVQAATALTDSLSPEQLAEFSTTGAIRFNAAQQQAIALLLTSSEDDDDKGAPTPEPLPASPEPKSKPKQLLGVDPDTLRALKQKLAPEQYGDALGQLNDAVALLRDPIAALAASAKTDDDEADAADDIDSDDEAERTEADDSDINEHHTNHDSNNSPTEEKDA